MEKSASKPETKSTSKAGNTQANAKATVQSFDIAKSEDTMNLASDLAKFINANKLYQNIQGKEYVNVEGWQYAGSRLGIFPVVQEVINMSDSAEIKFEAKVNLINLRSDQVVGAGFAICSNKEQGRKYYQEYAICSMAQTRAIGKAYRNALAWIIRAAGYEPTPAEEMDYQGNTPTPAKTETKKPENAPAPITAQSEFETEPKEKAQADAEADGLDAEAKKTRTPPPADEPPVKYASNKQKEEIIRLLNNPTITRQEKTKMLLNINKLDEERAKQSIAKLKKVIEDREKETAAAA